jgi:uncharacterized integral membrane protein
LVHLKSEKLLSIILYDMVIAKQKGDKEMTKFIQTNIVVMILFVVAMLNTDAIRFTFLGYAVILVLYLVVNLICYVVLVDQKVKA